MPIPLDAPEVLNREYLEIRALLLSVAAKLDRINRAETNGGGVAADPRMQQFSKGLEILRGAKPDRAERIQLLFSLPYPENWKHEFGLHS